MFDKIIEKLRSEKGIMIIDANLNYKITFIVKSQFAENLRPVNIIYHNYEKPDDYKAISFTLINDSKEPISYVAITATDKVLVTTKTTKKPSQTSYKYLDDEYKGIWLELFELIHAKYGKVMV